MREFVQKIINQIPLLVHQERVQVRAALDGVDDYKKVCDIIESRQDNDQHCPFCHRTRIYKHGHRSGLQRYKCAACDKTFNALTHTPLARMRKKALWLQYMDYMLNSLVLRDIAERLEVDKKTALLWRHHFSTWLYKDTPRILEGIVEADETYFRISKKGNRHLNRKPYKRGGQDSPRGLSKKQVCVFTAADRSHHSLEFIAGLGTVKGCWLDRVFQSRIAVDTVLVTDGLKSYTQFCQHNHINHVIVEKRSTGPYHIQHINAFHGRIKAWINGHFRGVATKYLHHYLWWRHELENSHITDAISLFRATIC